MILATAMLFVPTLMSHSIAPATMGTQEMDSLVEVIQEAVVDPVAHLSPPFLMP